jgi:electron transport complex protein RnfA
MIPLAALAVFSGLSLNLLLQFALGTRDLVTRTSYKIDGKRKISLFQIWILFIAVILLWVFFDVVMPVFWISFSEYFLYFPLSALVCIGLEFLGEQLLMRIWKKNDRTDKTFSALTAYDGLVPVSLFFTSAAAVSFKDAVILALFFALGNLAAMLILSEIRRKSQLEWIPKNFRGGPLIIVSMGLLSLIFASAAGICFKILEAF